jgi:Fur family ferric uptake transcriptional regulator
LKRVNLHKDSIYYELAKHHHHHIICTDCGTLESFEDCNIKNISKSILQNSSKFNSIDHHSLEFFGVCMSCAKI